jgi:hypothetical protein
VNNTRLKSEQIVCVDIEYYIIMHFSFSNFKIFPFILQYTIETIKARMNKQTNKNNINSFFSSFYFVKNLKKELDCINHV